LERIATASVVGRVVSCVRACEGDEGAIAEDEEEHRCLPSEGTRKPGFERGDFTFRTNAAQHNGQGVPRTETMSEEPDTRM
jgi:hypothetical protein